MNGNEIDLKRKENRAKRNHRSVKFLENLLGNLEKKG